MWLVGDGFAEGVEGDGDAFAVELLRGGDGLLDGHAGDKAVRDAAADGGALGKFAEGFVGGEADEEGTKHARESLGHLRFECRLRIHFRGITLGRLFVGCASIREYAWGPVWP